ncbi:hypothetical protein PINS_up015672 [Pythium insidiosum]|nr:hypothetical protein PINS_up015672 [Pythium insidiosum]
MSQPHSLYDGSEGSIAAFDPSGPTFEPVQGDLLASQSQPQSQPAPTQTQLTSSQSGGEEAVDQDKQEQDKQEADKQEPDPDPKKSVLPQHSNAQRDTMKDDDNDENRRPNTVMIAPGSS